MFVSGFSFGGPESEVGVKDEAFPAAEEVTFYHLSAARGDEGVLFPEFLDLLVPSLHEEAYVGVAEAYLLPGE